VREVLKAAEKVGGADMKFQQAASAIKTMNLLQKIRENPTQVGEDEYSEALGGLGITGTERDMMLHMFRTVRDNPDALTGDDGDGGEDGGVAGAAGGGAGKPSAEAARIAVLEQAIAALKAANDKTNLQNDAAKMRAGIEAAIRNTLTSDEVLGKIIVEEANGRPPSWENTETFAGEFFDDMMTLVRSRVTADPTRPVTPDEIQGMAGKIRHRLSRVGKALDPEQAHVKLTALGRAMGVAPKLQADEPIERVPVTSQAHKTNFVERMFQMYRKAKGQTTA
jgi:hypothetical protein